MPALSFTEEASEETGLWPRLVDRALQLWDAMAMEKFDSVPEVDAARRKKGRKHRKKKKPVPRLPRYASPHSPSRTNRYLTPLGYTQYYLPLNQHQNPNWTIEYITYPAEHIKKHLPAHMQGITSVLERTVEAPYRLKEWTIPHLLNLAKDLAGSKKLWKDYVRRMYVSSGYTG